MLLGVGVGLAHHDQDATVRMRGIGDEPLPAVDDVVVAVAPDRCGDVGRVRRRHIRFGHRERRADLAVEQGHQPLRALRGGGEHVQQFHVAGVRRIAVERLRGPRHPAHDLGQRRVLEVAQARAGFVVAQVRQEHVPQPLGTGQRLQVVHERHRIVAGMHFVAPGAQAWNDVVVHERAHALAQRFDLRGIGEIHSFLSRLGAEAHDQSAKIVTAKSVCCRIFLICSVNM